MGVWEEESWETWEIWETKASSAGSENDSYANKRQLLDLLTGKDLESQS